MKKILTLIAALGFFGATFGAPLDPAKAFQRVRGTANLAPGLADKIQTPRLVLTGNTEAGQPAYYVFDYNSTTLFVSADDVAVPLLGYSDSGKFDPQNMPPQLKWWLKQYASEIEWASKNGVAPASASQQRRVTSSMPAIEPLLKTTWNQDAPYNKYAPSIGGEQCVTGCVATAMAQVMNHYQWPQSEVPEISYSWRNQTLTSPATTLDWNNMLASYVGEYTDAQADAVARLMQLAGYSVNMNYELSAYGGSGAPTHTVRNAFVNTFGYDVAADMLYRDYYSPEDWLQLIYNELKTSGPVYYDGQGDEGGHAFVCDGYDGNGSFHFNWGWSGYCDGYFLLSALNPGGLGIGGGGGGYNYDQAALFNVGRPKGGSVAPAPYIACSYELTGENDYGGFLTIKAGRADAGFYNFGYESAKFTFGVRLESVETGDVVNITSNIMSQELSTFRGFDSFEVEIYTSRYNGEYRIYPIYKIESGDWQLMKLKYGTPQYLSINISNGGLSIDYGQLTIESWTSDVGFMRNKPFEGRLEVYNYFNTEKTLTLDAYLCNGTFDVCAELGSVTETFKPYVRGSMTFKGVLPNLAAGQYYLVFKENGIMQKYFPVEVSVVEGTVTVLSVTPTPNPLRPGEASSVEVVLQSTYDEPIEFFVELILNSIYVVEEKYFTTLLNYGTKSVTIPADGTQTVVFSGTLPENITKEDRRFSLVVLGSLDSDTFPQIASVDVDVADPLALSISFSATPNPIETGNKSSVKAVFTNTYKTAKEFNGGLYLLSRDADGNWNPDFYYGTQKISVPASGSKTITYNSTIPSDFAPGNYMLAIIDFDETDIVDYTFIDVVKGENSGGDESDEWEIVPTSWRQVTGFVAGDEFEGYLTVTNTYPTQKTASFDAYLCKVESNSYVIYAKLGSASGEIPAKSTGELKYSGTLARINPGDYYLVFAKDMSMVSRIAVKVAAGEEGEITVTRLAPLPKVLTLGDSSKVEVDMKSTFSSAQQVNMALYLCTLSGQSLSIRHTYGEQTLTIPGKTSITTSFSTKIPSTLAPGTYYVVLYDTAAGETLDYVAVELKNPLSGIEAVDGDEVNGECRYFNLKGVEVSADNLTPGAYIVRQGSQTKKVLIK